MAERDLSASVGVLAIDDHGRGNLSDDVKWVKRLLNAHAAAIKLAVPLDVNNPFCGETTKDAIKAFQRIMMKKGQPSGRIKPLSRGGDTLKALLKAPTSLAVGLPPRPSFGTLDTEKKRQLVFGEFEFDWTPKPGNYEAITMKGNWKTNIVGVKVDMGPAVGTRTIWFHRRAAKQVAGLWAAWKAAGLLHHVLTYDGDYVSRYMRVNKKTRAANKQPTSLSMHAYGAAFDINETWNKLGVPPAAAGTHGSVQELVPLAHQWGFYWGGHFGKRPDGMHFEVAKLV